MSGRAPSGQALAVPAEPISVVSALTGFDPSRKNDVFQIQLDLKRRAAALDNGVDAARALQWLNEYGLQILNGSTFGADFSGSGEAKSYLDKARKAFAERIHMHAVALARADMEGAAALATEARRAETPKSDSVHEGAGLEEATPKGHHP